METAITINTLLTALGVIVAIVAGAGAIGKIIKFINEEHDRMEKYEAYEKQIQENKKAIEIGHKCATDELQKIREETTESLRMMQDDTDAKLQEIKAEQCMLTYCMMATLDGLHQLGANGKVTEARQMLDKHLNKTAHGVD